MKIVFMGTAEFAVPSLLKLAENENIIAVITAVDKPQGRGYNIESTPVKKAAEELGLPAISVEKLKGEDITEKIRELNPDLITVVDFGMIIPPSILDIPKYGVICLHPSLLPKYRGPSPIEYALLNGDNVTGNTIFYVVKEVDSGDIIIQKEHKITEDDNNGSLRKTLASEGANLFLEAVQLIKTNKAVRNPQNHAEAVLTKKLEKENINWSENAQTIFNKIRAYTPKPGISTTYKGKKIKITKSKVVDIPAGEALDVSGSRGAFPAPIEKNNDTGSRPERREARAVSYDNGSRGHLGRAICPGEIIDIIKDEGFVVSCGDSGLLILEVHPESKNIMSAWNFANGYRIIRGDRLG